MGLVAQIGLVFECNIQAVGARGMGLAVWGPADLAEVYFAVGYSDSVAAE